MPSMSAFKKRFSIFQPSTSEAISSAVEPVGSTPEPVDSTAKQPDNQPDVIPPKKEERNISFSTWFWRFLTTNPILLAFVIFLVIILVSGLPFLITYFIPLQGTPSDAGVCSVNDQFRFECFPDVEHLTDQQCDEWNCCWNEKALARCYHRFPSSYRLNTTRDQLLPSTSNSTRRVVLSLEPLDTLPNLPGYDKNYQQESRMTMVVEKVNKKYVRTRVLLNPADKSQVQYDNSVIDPDVVDFDYEVYYARDSPRQIFTFQVSRNGANYSLFNLNSGGGLVLSKNYAEVTILLPPSCAVYGLGFGTHQKLRHSMNWKPWTLFNNYTDFTEGSALYGTHPVYLCVEKDGQAHGVFFNNNYLMEARLQPAPAITFRTVGGDLDFHILLGPTPNDVIAQLSEIPGVGKPAMPPYWALGYHLCPVTDKMANFMDIVDEMNSKNISFESSCINADIWRHWLMNPKGREFDDFKTFARKLKNNNQKTFVVTFPQILEHADSGRNTITEVYKNAIKKGIYLKNSDNKKLEGQFLGDAPVIFPDPTHPESLDWMAELIQQEGNEFFDGFLLNWNTPVDFTNRTDLPCKSPLEHPPFLPAIGMSSVSENTFCMDVRYHSNDTHAAMRNQYGRRHAQLLRDALLLTRPKERPFIISLSTQMGSGAIGGHWGGEYLATWEGLKNSLVNVLEGSLYSISMSGVPIAGNIRVVERELWARWFQLGVFYPLALSYYELNEGDRHPAAMKGSVVHYKFASSALKLRYSLLPYLYTLFHEAATQGLPVARPMFFEFPESEDAQVADEQFMWGSSLLIVPCLQQNATTVRTWMPEGLWFELKTGSILNGSASWVQLPSPQFFLNLYLRTGHVIPMHDICSHTTECRKTNYTLLVGLKCSEEDSKNCVANGSLYLDDGETVDSSSLTVLFTVKNSTLRISQGLFDSDLENYYRNEFYSVTLQTIRIYGIFFNPSAIVVDDDELLDWAGGYDSIGYTLTINHPINLTSFHKISWY